MHEVYTLKPKIIAALRALLLHESPDPLQEVGLDLVGHRRAPVRLDLARQLLHRELLVALGADEGCGAAEGTRA